MTAFVDRHRIVQRAIEDATKRSPRILSSPSHLRDDEWEHVVETIRQKGPLSPGEMLAYQAKHDAAAKAYFLALVFECERLYEIVRVLSESGNTQ